MKILITTLSLGTNYTKDYTLRLIEDVLSMTDIDVYITTDSRHLIDEKFGLNDRIKIKEIDRKDLKVALPIGPHRGSSDFNFNMRYMCLDHVKDIENSIVIFTDCDNSFDWWDKTLVIDFIQKKFAEGYDYFAPRTDLKLKNLISKYNELCCKNPLIEDLNTELCTFAWHKFFNYDMIDPTTKKVMNESTHEWSESSFPSEYLVVLYNNNGKLAKMVDQWKWFHDYLVNKDFTFGTWAEGFEIGVSALVAGFKDFDISYSHPIWSKIFTPNGYKTGPRGGIVHATEK